jgi:hypothetical protein
MNKLFLISALVFAAACGGKSGGGSDPCKDKKMGMMTCDQMAASVAGHMREAGQVSEADVGTMQGMFASQCTDHAWSQEAIDCMGKATNSEEGEACSESKLDADQQASLDEGFKAAGGGGDTDDGMDDEGDDEGMGDEEEID